MNFWKKYKAKKELTKEFEKAKKELREKLEKARFINFYGNQIDLSLGRIKELICYSTETSEKDGIFTVFIINYYIILRYDNFKEIFLSYGNEKSIRDDRYCELISFANSDKFTEYLNNYENLKKEYEQLL